MGIAYDNVLDIVRFVSYNEYYIKEEWVKRNNYPKDMILTLKMTTIPTDFIIELMQEKEVIKNEN